MVYHSRIVTLHPATILHWSSALQQLQQATNYLLFRFAPTTSSHPTFHQSATSASKLERESVRKRKREEETIAKQWRCNVPQSSFGLRRKKEEKEIKKKKKRDEEEKQTTQKTKKKMSSNFARVSDGLFQLRWSRFYDILRSNMSLTRAWNIFEIRGSEAPLSIAFLFLVCALQ